MQAVQELTLSSAGRHFRLSAAAARALRLHLRGKSRSEQRGLLFGRGESECEILVIRPLPPDSARTGSLEDIALACRALQEPPQDETGLPLQAVGWYVSQTRRPSALRSAQRSFHDSLFTPSHLILLCQQARSGEIQFMAGGDLTGKEDSRSTWSGWLWPAAAATLFALVCVTASLAFRPGAGVTPEPLAVIVRQTAAIQPLTQPSTQLPLPPSTPDQSELAFEQARNRRLEATLGILRERKVHKHMRGQH